ncbi:MAG: dockerin type I domain-containing protein [Planctomycetia bacterium]|jgi:hypothetical protein
MKKLFLVLCMVAILGLMLTTANAVTVDTTAYFDGGLSTDVPDAYEGVWGDGWGGAWGIKTGSLTTNNVTVTDITPLSTGDGNYLEVDIVANSTTSSGAAASVYRDYVTKGSEIYFGEDFNVSFDLRIDAEGSITGTKDRFSFGITDSPYTTTRTGDTFYLSGRPSAGGWRVIDGYDEGTGGVVFRYFTGVTFGEYLYNVSVNVHPATQMCELTINNLTLSETETISDLDWRGATTLGQYLNFIGNEETQDESASFSIDNLIISQEITPGTMSEVVNYFDGGNTNTVPDAYMGSHGDGWLDEWGSKTYTGGITSTRTVITSADTGFSELHTGDGNYLEVVLPNEDILPSTYSVARSYKTSDGVDFTDDHSVSFSIRMDEEFLGGMFSSMYNENDKYFITGSNTTRGGMSSADTFGILVQGAEGTIGPNDEVTLAATDANTWVFVNGDGAGGITGYTSSGITIAEDGVYDFTITYDVDAKTYSVTINDGVNPEVTVSDLGWITADDMIGGFLNFGAGADYSDDIRAFSLDNIVITSLAEEWPAGDANKDNKVDASDATILAGNWQAGPGATWEMGDFNGDGYVDASDATILAGNWQFGTGATSVPEPSTLIGLVTLLLAGWCVVRRR